MNIKNIIEKVLSEDSSYADEEVDSIIAKYVDGKKKSYPDLVQPGLVLDTKTKTITASDKSHFPGELRYETVDAKIVKFILKVNGKTIVANAKRGKIVRNKNEAGHSDAIIAFQFILSCNERLKTNNFVAPNGTDYGEKEFQNRLKDALNDFKRTVEK